jgi:hypothetical protein
MNNPVRVRSIWRQSIAITLFEKLGMVFKLPSRQDGFKETK